MKHIVNFLQNCVQIAEETNVKFSFEQLFSTEICDLLKIQKLNKPALYKAIKDMFPEKTDAISKAYTSLMIKELNGNIYSIPVYSYQMEYIGGGGMYPAQYDYKSEKVFSIDVKHISNIETKENGDIVVYIKNMEGYEQVTFHKQESDHIPLWNMEVLQRSEISLNKMLNLGSSKSNVFMSQDLQVPQPGSGNRYGCNIQKPNEQYRGPDGLGDLFSAFAKFGVCHPNGRIASIKKIIYDEVNTDSLGD